MNNPDIKWVYNVAENGNRNAQFLFLHIPKTGGTTFRYVLYNHFDDKNIYPSQADLVANGGGYLSRKEFIKNESYRNKAMLIGHFRIGVINQIKNRRVKKLAFFRNPLDRILSTIKHIKVYDKNFADKNVNEILDIKWDQIVHGQCMAMGYTKKEKNLEVVIQNIKDLDFIGITEFFNESLQLCNETFNWELEPISKKNEIKEEVFSELSSISKVKILSSLAPELRTYNFALKQFIRRCKQNNIELDI